MIALLTNPAVAFVAGIMVACLAHGLVDLARSTRALADEWEAHHRAGQR